MPLLPQSHYTRGADDILLALCASPYTSKVTAALQCWQNAALCTQRL